jgi:hypothetical protein
MELDLDRQRTDNTLQEIATGAKRNSGHHLLHHPIKLVLLPVIKSLATTAAGRIVLYFV